MPDIWPDQFEQEYMRVNFPNDKAKRPNEPSKPISIDDEIPGLAALESVVDHAIGMEATAQHKLDNEIIKDNIRNEGRLAFASGFPGVPPQQLTEEAQRIWSEGYIAANSEKERGSKRKKPRDRVARAERITDALGEHSGGSVDYYKLHIANPTHAPAPYDVECNDIIEALEMDYAEGNVFKAIWRTAAARQGKMKRGHDAVYDAEKIGFFGQRLLERAKRLLQK